MLDTIAGASRLPALLGVIFVRYVLCLNFVDSIVQYMVNMSGTVGKVLHTER